MKRVVWVLLEEAVDESDNDKICDSEKEASWAEAATRWDERHSGVASGVFLVHPHLWW